jgi:hypothetical protein
MKIYFPWLREVGVEGSVGEPSIHPTKAGEDYDSSGGETPRGDEGDDAEL